MVTKGHGSSDWCIYNNLAGEYINPLYSGNPITSTFANSEDPDEMQHNAAFHHGLHSLLR